MNADIYNYVSQNSDVAELSDQEICGQITKLTVEMMKFWGNCNGWALPNAANLLNEAMLGWQVSLSETLRLWIHKTSVGELILAWTNLGTLVEGQLKLFLCIYLNDYEKDPDAYLKARTQKQIEPHNLTLQQARLFIKKKGIWSKDCNWDCWIQYIQDRRNSIHAFKPCNIGIGTFNEWKKDIRVYLFFLRDMKSRLPYPCDEF